MLAFLCRAFAIVILALLAVFCSVLGDQALPSYWHWFFGANAVAVAAGLAPIIEAKIRNSGGTP